MSETNGSMSRDFILGYEDGYQEKLEIPEWGGGHIYVRNLGSKDRDAFEAKFAEDQSAPGGDKSLDNFRARFCVKVIVDHDGNRIFSEEDSELLGKKSSAALSRIYDVAARINHITQKDLEDAVKN